MVDINTQCLEGSLAGFLNCLFLFLFRKEIKSFFDYLTQFCGSINMIASADLIGNGFGEFLTLWFIRIFTEQSRKLLSGNGIQTLGCTDAGFLIQAQIQRSVCFKRETSFGVINLHG